MQQLRYFFMALLAVIAFILLISMLIIGRAIIASSAPFFVLLLEGVIIYAILASLAGLTWHYIRKSKREEKLAELEAERYRFETRKLNPIGANYPVIYEDGEMIQARPGVLPQAVPTHYAPHITIKSEERALADTLEEEGSALQGPVLPHALPFSTIIEEVRPGHVCLGCGPSGAIFGSIDDLLSTAIVGRPGTGKTTLLRFVSAQVLRIAGTPMLWDPHGNIADELGDMLECAESPKGIDTSAKQLERMLEQRLQERRQGKRDFMPTLLLADEWPVIAAMCAHSISTMKRVVLEGRKVGMYALISGQGLPAALLDGTLVRDALSSRYVFNTTAQQARLAGLDNETAKEMLAVLDTTGPGRAILASSRLRPEVVAIPHTSVDDIRACLAGSVRSMREADTEARREAVGSTFPEIKADTLTQSLRLIGKRLKNGETPNDIRRSLGVTGGRAMQEINAALQLIEQDETIID